jgi:hypothetical protein
MMVLWFYLIQVNRVNINLIHRNQFQVVQHFLLVRKKRLIKRRKFFYLANIQFNERHYNEVIRVLPLRITK